jgi:hypothetical protein
MTMVNIKVRNLPVGVLQKVRKEKLVEVAKAGVEPVNSEEKQ